MTEETRELIARLHPEELERIRNESPLPRYEPPAPPYPDLPEVPPDSPVAEEWNIFRRELGRLIVEGRKGKFALIKAGQPSSVWDTLHDAAQAGQLLDGQGPCLVQQIQPTLPPLRVGYNRLCRD
jgi:hypothetical protein